MEAVGIPSAHVLGHSFGGRVAIALAAEYPCRIRKLVLVASAGIRPRRSVNYYVKVGTVKLVAGLFSPRLWGSLAHRARSALNGWAGSRDYRQAGPLRPTMVKVVNEDLRPLLESIRVPTLIVWGDRDPEVPEAAARIMAQGIRGSRLEIFNGAGHFLFADMPDRFAGLVCEFLREGAAE